jgi:pimeloyl-ACP methyl ester carboxylesterase
MLDMPRQEPISPEAWRTLGSELALPDGRVFSVVLGKEQKEQEERLPVLVLHGFPSSSWDFADAAAEVAETGRRRVVLFDFLGFGLSDKPVDAAYSLFEQADLAVLVARAHGLKRVHLWAHDMGTSVATELLARRERGLLPFEVASVTLMNGSVHIEMASLTLGQQLLRSPLGDAFARVAGRRIFGAQLRRILGKPVTDDAIDGMWAFMTRADGTLRLPKTIRYIEERHRFGRRWIGALERLEQPLLVAWGMKDPVARLEIGERLAEDTAGAELVRWPDLGHYPQVEDSARVAADVGGFFSRHDGDTGALTAPRR